MSRHGCDCTTECSHYTRLSGSRPDECRIPSMPIREVWPSNRVMVYNCTRTEHRVVEVQGELFDEAG